MHPGRSRIGVWRRPSNVGHQSSCLGAQRLVSDVARGAQDTSRWGAARINRANRGCETCSAIGSRPGQLNAGWHRTRRGVTRRPRSRCRFAAGDHCPRCGPLSEECRGLQRALRAPPTHGPGSSAHLDAARRLASRVLEISLGGKSHRSPLLEESRRHHQRQRSTRQ